MTDHPTSYDPTYATTLPVLLIVEDDADIGVMLVHLFQSETPYLALLVTDAVQALEVVKSITPSLFILDYRLPGMDGLELADRLHMVKSLEAAPILMVSAYSPDRQATQQRGIIYLKKPFDLTRFLQTVEKLLPRTEEGKNI